jgi:diacylglycerol O-acyltransferase / wax synthase
VAGVVAFVDLPGLEEVEPPALRSAPTTTDLLADVAGGWLRRLGRLGGALVHPLRTGRALAEEVRTLRRAMGVPRLPDTSLLGHLGQTRRCALLRADLGAVRAAAHAQGATVNDVLLCAVSGGLRALLASRGEHPEGLTLRAAVPVALHDGAEAGNRDGGLMVSLPVGEADPAVRLRRIAAETTQRKRDAVFGGATSALFSSPVVQRAVVRLSAGQRLSVTSLANLKGPPLPLTLAGAPIAELHPMVPLVGNLTVAFGALSYDGRLGITVVADGEACTDLDVLADALERDLDALTRTAAVRG